MIFSDCTMNEIRHQQINENDSTEKLIKPTEVSPLFSQYDLLMKSQSQASQLNTNKGKFSTQDILSNINSSSSKNSSSAPGSVLHAAPNMNAAAAYDLAYRSILQSLNPAAYNFYTNSNRYLQTGYNPFSAPLDSVSPLNVKNQVSTPLSSLSSASSVDASAVENEFKLRQQITPNGNQSQNNNSAQERKFLHNNTSNSYESVSPSLNDDDDVDEDAEMNSSEIDVNNTDDINANTISNCTNENNHRNRSVNEDYGKINESDKCDEIKEEQKEDGDGEEQYDEENSRRKLSKNENIDEQLGEKLQSIKRRSSSVSSAGEESFVSDDAAKSFSSENSSKKRKTFEKMQKEIISDVDKAISSCFMNKKLKSACDEHEHEQAAENSENTENENESSTNKTEANKSEEFMESLRSEIISTVQSVIASTFKQYNPQESLIKSHSTKTDAKNCLKRNLKYENQSNSNCIAELNTSAAAQNHKRQRLNDISAKNHAQSQKSYETAFKPLGINREKPRVSDYTPSNHIAPHFSAPKTTMLATTTTQQPPNIFNRALAFQNQMLLRPSAGAAHPPHPHQNNAFVNQFYAAAMSHFNQQPQQPTNGFFPSFPNRLFAPYLDSSAAPPAQNPLLSMPHHSHPMEPNAFAAAAAAAAAVFQTPTKRRRTKVTDTRLSPRTSSKLASGMQASLYCDDRRASESPLTNGDDDTNPNQDDDDMIDDQSMTSAEQYRSASNYESNEISNQMSNANANEFMGYQISFLCLNYLK